MSKITKSVSGTTATFTQTAQTMVDRLIVGAMAPLALMSSEEPTEFYDKKTVAAAALGWFTGGAIVGRVYGGSIPGLKALQPKA